MPRYIPTAPRSRLLVGSKGWAFCLFLGCLFVLGGCKQESKVPVLLPVPSNGTPEGQLARIMQRLEDALQTAQASTTSGVVSERRAYQKILRPEGKSGPITAEIAIETRRALAPLALNKTARAKLDKEIKEAEKEGKTLDGDPKGPLIVQDTEQIETKVFQLAYDGKRWDLVKEIDAESDDSSPSMERILFDYALKAN